MSQTKIINIKSGESYDIYIGRPNKWRKLSGSIWANPFKIGPDGDRNDVVKKYREYVLNKPELLTQLATLKGKILACWCKPDACHGDILIELIENLETE